MNGIFFYVKIYICTYSSIYTDGNIWANQCIITIKKKRIKLYVSSKIWILFNLRKNTISLLLPCNPYFISIKPTIKMFLAQKFAARSIQNRNQIQYSLCVRRRLLQISAAISIVYLYILYRGWRCIILYTFNGNIGMYI